MPSVSPSRSLARRCTNYEDPRSLVSRIRRRRIGPLLELVAEARRRHGEVRILDLGGTRAYWTILPAEVLAAGPLRVTLVNLPGAELPADDERFTHVAADACELGGRFPDGSFHIVHSNSVIEHVGDWQRMRAFAREVRRLAPAYFVQTPNFWFPVEPHFMAPLFHWLPEPTRVAIVRHLGLGHRERQPDVGRAVAEVQSVRLLSRPMFAHLFPDARLVVERMLGLPKSLIAIRGFDGR
jgi:hypothetical protein